VVPHLPYFKLKEVVEEDEGEKKKVTTNEVI